MVRQRKKTINTYITKGRCSGGRTGAGSLSEGRGGVLWMRLRLTVQHLVRRWVRKESPCSGGSDAHGCAGILRRCGSGPPQMDQLETVAQQCLHCYCHQSPVKWIEWIGEPRHHLMPPQILPWHASSL